MTKKSEHAKIFYRTGGMGFLKIKNVSFELDEATHLKLKIKCATLDIHIKVYVADLVKRELEESKEV